MVGELYAIDTATLEVLDDFEGHPDLYQRTTITLDDGGEAIAYLFPRARWTDQPVIASGDYKAR